MLRRCDMVRCVAIIQLPTTRTVAAADPTVVETLTVKGFSLLPSSFFLLPSPSKIKISKSNRPEPAAPQNTC
jgi:hypothetical protein